MVAYTYGPLLGILLAAILPGRRSLNGLIAGVIVSILIVAWVRPELRQLLTSLGADELAASLLASRPQLADPWFYPINVAVTLLGAFLPLGRMVGKNRATTSSRDN